MRDTTDSLRAQVRRIKGRTTTRAVSYWDWMAALCQGREEEAAALWEQMPDEQRRWIEEAATMRDPTEELETRINAPLNLPCGLKELPHGEGKDGLLSPD